MGMTKRVHEALVRVEDVIDVEYEPERMTPEEALEFLETIVANTRVKIESLKEENDID